MEWVTPSTVNLGQSLPAFYSGGQFILFKHGTGANAINPAVHTRMVIAVVPQF